MLSIRLCIHPHLYYLLFLFALFPSHQQEAVHKPVLIVTEKGW